MIQIFKNIVSWFKSLFSKKNHVHQHKVINKKRLLPNLKVWEADLITGDVVPAEIEVEITFDLKGKPRKNRKVLIRENCIYEYAMNGENAVRKLETRILNSINKSK